MDTNSAYLAELFAVLDSLLLCYAMLGARTRGLEGKQYAGAFAHGLIVQRMRCLAAATRSSPQLQMLADGVQTKYNRGRQRSWKVLLWE